MITKLTISDVQRVYTMYKKCAFGALAEGNYVRALGWSYSATRLIQQFNWEYADDELEQILNATAEHILLNIPNEYKPNGNRVVVLDDWCTSYVLVLQYIDALVAAGTEILYITSVDVDASKHKNILERLTAYPKLTYQVEPRFTEGFEQWCEKVYNLITDFAPSKVVAHIGPYSFFLPVLARLPKEIDRYRSNLDDQCFWLGKTVIDYVLEFRPFGVAVSRERRGIKPEQQLYVPFYPVKDGNPFGGFPELPKDSVILFSGGDFYKTLDPNYTYWNLVKRVLQENTKAVLLCATKNGLRTQQEFLERFVKENHLEKQFYIIGFRPDINEVFAHADIFLGTCPVCGSLTSQLAALNHTAILQYYLPNTDDDETEQALNYNNPDLQLSFSDEDAFLVEAKRLIEDKAYRRQKADLAYEATIKPEQFNKVFMDAITTNVAPCPTKKVDYAEVCRRWWWPEEMGFVDHLGDMILTLKYYRLVKKDLKLWMKYNYQRFITKKLFSPAWYKYRVKVIGERLKVRG